MKYILILLISLSFLSIDTFARGGGSGGGGRSGGSSSGGSSSGRSSSSPSRSSSVSSSSSRSGGYSKSSSSSSSSSSCSSGWGKSTYTKSAGNTQGYSSKQSTKVYIINSHPYGYGGYHPYGYYSYRGFGFWDYYLWMHIMYPHQNVNNYYGGQTKNSCKSDRECLVREKCDILQNTCISR